MPALIILLLVIHMVILARQKHTQFPGKGRREDNVVGLRLWPTYAMKAVGVFFLTSAVLALIGGLVQINPIWMFGPFRVADVSSASQPDWYLGWLEGALRLMPAWELRASPFEIPNPFYPSMLLTGITFAVLYAWPWLEARLTGDHETHHLLDRPSERPVRTSLGLATLSFFGVLFVAGSDDVLAVWMNVSVNVVVRVLQFLAIVLPVLVFVVSRSVMNRRLEKREELGEGPPTSVGHSPWEARLAVLLVAGFIFVMVSALSTKSPPDLPETWTAEANAGLTGEQLYSAACAQCHGNNLEGNFGPALGPDTESVQMSDTLIKAVVFSGIGTMRSMSGVLTEEQAEEVVSYIRQFQGG